MYSYNGILCVLCTGKKSDDKPHLLQCKAIASNLNNDEVARGQIQPCFNNYQDNDSQPSIHNGPKHVVWPGAED